MSAPHDHYETPYPAIEAAGGRRPRRLVPALAAAAVLALAACGGDNGGGGGGAPKNEEEAIAKCANEQPPLNFPQLDGGLSYVEADPQFVQQFKQQLPANPPEVRAGARVRVVAQGQTPEVVVLSAPISGEEEGGRDELVNGYLEGARKQGTAEPSDIEIAGEQATLVRQTSGDGKAVAVIASARCRALIAIGQKEQLVRDLATRVLEANKS